MRPEFLLIFVTKIKDFETKSQKIKEVYQWDDKPTEFYDFVAKIFNLQ